VARGFEAARQFEGTAKKLARDFMPAKHAE
jgi:hypothetical protein